MRAVTPITLVMAYYENPGMLQRHYDAWRKFDPTLWDHLQVVVVDDGSPNYPAKPPERPPFSIDLQIYRVHKDVRWNQDACRNIGVSHAQTNWVLLTDIDHEVTEETWKYLVTRAWDDAVAYKFRRVSAPDMEAYKPHPNSWLMSRKLFDAAGGYDERFAGLYGTDGEFRDRVSEFAKETVILKQSLIRVPRQVVPDASTTTYLRKQPEDRVGLARVREARDAEEVQPWIPLRGSFEYSRIFP